MGKGFPKMKTCLWS